MIRSSARLAVCVAILAASAGHALAEEKRLPVVAVFEFDDLTAPARTDGPAWQQSIALLFSRTFEATQCFEVVDRWRIQEIIDSLALAEIAVIDPVTVSRQLNADYLVLGDFNRIGVDRFIINVRIQNAASGSLVPKCADNRELAASDLSSFVADATIKFAGGMGAKLSKSGHKQVNQVGTRSPQALDLIGQSLLLRRQNKYETSLVLLDSARRFDKNFTEIERQITEVTALLELQKSLTSPEQK